MVNHEAEACVSLVPIFNHLPPTDISSIATLVHERLFATGEHLFSEGTPASTLYIVAHGQVKITKGSANGREQLLLVMNPGDFDGEAVLFTPSEHTTTATALAPTRVCTISRRAFQTLLARTPPLTLNILNALGARLIELQKRSTESMLTSISERLASYLVDTSAALNATSFELPLMKKDLALYLGTTPETISRKLAAFSDQGLIKITGRKHVEILNVDALALTE